MQRGPSGFPVPSDSVAFRERKEKADSPRRIDGARRAWRQIRIIHLISTMTLMKALHQKKSGCFGSIDFESSGVRFLDRLGMTATAGTR
jgi:hypothetical protein